MASDVHNVLAVKFHRTLFTNHAQRLINANSNLPGFSEENVDVVHNSSETNTVSSDIRIKWNPASLENGVNIGDIE